MFGQLAFMTDEAIQSGATTGLVRREMTLVRAVGRVYCRVFDFDDVDEGGCRGIGCRGKAAEGRKPVNDRRVV